MTYNFDIEIATRIGVDEAIMLNNFVYWLLKRSELWSGRYIRLGDGAKGWSRKENGGILC